MAHNLALPEETKAGFAPINGIDLYFETTGQGQPIYRVWKNQRNLTGSFWSSALPLEKSTQTETDMRRKEIRMIWQGLRQML